MEKKSPLIEQFTDIKQTQKSSQKLITIDGTLSNRIIGFICYSHSDAKWCKEVEISIKSMNYKGLKIKTNPLLQDLNISLYVLRDLHLYHLNNSACSYFLIIKSNFHKLLNRIFISMSEEEEEKDDLKDTVLQFLFDRESVGSTLNEITSHLLFEKIDPINLEICLDEMLDEGLIIKSPLSAVRIIYRISTEGISYLSYKDNSFMPFTKPISSTVIAPKKEKVTNTSKTTKKILFISYANGNINKVNLIVKELKDHPLFVPLVVANEREPNKALIKKVTNGIKSSYKVIAILTKDSFQEQWINQEIGYAFGKKIEVIPIIEQVLLDNDSLKGFIHKQNDCPYTYETKPGLKMREENKLFMGKFRLLIKDLGNKFIKEKVKETTDKEANQKEAQIKKAPRMIRTTIPLKPLGTIVLSGDPCPVDGIWETDGDPVKTVSIRKGNKMPFVGTLVRQWKLIDYKPVK